MSTTFLLNIALCLSPAARAAKGDRAEEALRSAGERGPAASAAEIPALASLLQKAGWEPTPELSGVFAAGSIFERTELGHRALSNSCVAASPVESSYTSAELVTSLQAGVAVGNALWGAEGSAGIVKKVKFGIPSQVTIPGLELVLTPACVDKLKQLPVARLQSAYVVQEVLKAEISQQTCGRVDAKGRFLGLGEADADFAAACAQTSLEPVAVGYRTVPLLELMGGGTLPALVAAPKPAPVPAPAPAPSPKASAPAPRPASSSPTSPAQKDRIAIRQGPHWQASLGAESWRDQWTSSEGSTSTTWSTSYGPALQLGLSRRFQLRLRLYTARFSANEVDWLKEIVDASKLDQIADWRQSEARLAAFWSPPLDSALGRLSVGVEGSWASTTMSDSLEQVNVTTDYDRSIKWGPALTLVRPTHFGAFT